MNDLSQQELQELLLASELLTSRLTLRLCSQSATLASCQVRLS